MKRLLSLQSALLLVAGLFAALHLSAAEPVVKTGDRVAVVGDSITEQKQYSRNIELYLLCCQPQLKVWVMQFGWGGERANGFQRRMDNDLGPFAPNVVTTCYGMNDGGYRAYNESIGKAYEDPMRDIVERLKKTGATVVVGSPGTVDSFTFRRDPEQATVYNDNLAHLRDIAKQVAADNGMPFANVYDALNDTMVKAKAEFGKEYPVCGGDGVHPGANGHLVMAYAFLKAMGFDGDLGTIAVDFTGKATATGGHTVKAKDGGKVEVESTRYPFCFTQGDQRKILPFTTFNQDLNRLTLKVTNLPSAKAKITWGTESKVFTKAQLESGINLAAEFLDNPFLEQFRKVEGAVARKESFETVMIKGQISQYPWLERELGDSDDLKNALNTLREGLWKRQADLAVEVAAQVTPVTHTVEIEPVTE